MQVIGTNEYINLFSTVRLCANYLDAIVTVQQIGPHTCGFNGFKTQKGVKFIARHNDRLELLYGKHAYEIEFNPPPSVESLTVRKRSHELESEETENKAKMLKRDCSENRSEGFEDDREKGERLSSYGVHSNPKGFSTHASTSTKESKETLSTSTTWDSVDNGKLLIYTTPSVLNRANVILIINYKFYLICLNSVLINKKSITMNFYK